MTDFPISRPGQFRVKLEEVTPTIVAAYADTPCLIWSEEHSAWWRAECAGYTTAHAAAGRYTISAAYAATSHCDPSKGIAFERIEDGPVADAPQSIADRVRARRAARDASGVLYVDGSIYEGMAACLVRGGRTVAHVVDYEDAVEIAGAVTAFGKSAPTFQQRVQPWLIACFGEMIAGDREERNHRFLEEGLELVQAAGCTASEAHQLVDYVFGRPVGEPVQEVGGVMVTLAALCLANDLDMHTAAEAELERIWTKVDAIRAKQAAKPKHSPLPAHVEASRVGIVMEIVDSAKRDIARTQTDFLGRMAECLCTYEGLVGDNPDGELSEDDREEADDAITGLAALALAQAAMLRHPAQPAAALSAAAAGMSS